MDIRIDPGLTLTEASVTGEGARITIEVGEQQSELWNVYDQVAMGDAAMHDVQGITQEAIVPFTGEDGRRWYRTTVEIGEEVNERLRQAARAVCRGWEQAVTEEGSGDSRTNVEETFQEMVVQLSAWTAYSAQGMEVETPEDLIELLEGLDDMETAMPDDPYQTKYAPSPDELENLL